MLIRTKLLGALAAVFVLAGSANAALLGLDLEDFPDIASRFIDVTYSATTDQLLVDGFALLYDDDGSVPPEAIMDGGFLIDATIDGNGMPVAGALSVTGDVSGFGPNLLMGTLLQFGFQDGGGPIFEFTFEVSGGDLANDFGGVGTVVGVILSGSGFEGSFNQDFDNLIGGQPGTGSAVADLAPLPAPAALALLALAGFASPRRRRAV